MESDPPFEVVIPIPVPVPVPDDDLIAEIERLRAELAAAIQQRDEARMMYCVEAARHSVCRRSMMDKQTIAEMNGWDCFAQQEWGGA